MTALSPRVAARQDELFRQLTNVNHRYVDGFFAAGMVLQWVAGIATAFWVSPTTWIGAESQTHLHVWLSVILGGLITAFPVWLAIYHPGKPITRHVIAAAQGFWGALLIHLSGGRIETHFHVFVSLAFIAFYRDWKVIVTITAVVGIDHAVRGIFYPLSVYGVALESPYRWLEHTFWVLLEDSVLIAAVRQNTQQLASQCRDRAELEATRDEIERTVEERTRELKAITQEAELLSLIARYTDNAVTIADADGRVEWVNEGFTALCGYTAEEAYGRKPGEFLQGPATDRSIVDLMRQRLAKQQGFEVEILNYHKNGTPYWCQLEVRPVIDGTGKLYKFIALTRDITSRYEAEAEMKRLNRRLMDASRKAGMADVASGILHNVGNVLNSVNISAIQIQQHLEQSGHGKLLKAANTLEQQENLGEFLTTDPRGKHFTAFLHSYAVAAETQNAQSLQEANQLLRYIDHVNQVIRMQQEHARSGGAIEEFVIREVMEDAITMSGVTNGRHGVTLTRHFDDADDVISTDRHQVVLILINLIRNAFQALRQSYSAVKEIRLVIRRESDGFVELAVEDNGTGFSEETRNSLFKCQFTTKDDGHGFGLHSSANIAKDLGGMLTAHSDGPGCGACFSLRLPLQDVVPAEATPELTAAVAE